MVTTVKSKKTGAVRVIGKLRPGSTVGNVTIKQGTSYSTSRQSLQNTAQYGGSARPSTPVSSQISGNDPNVVNTDKEAARQQFLKQTLQNIERTKGVQAANAYRSQIQQSEYNRRANIINQSKSGSSSGVVKQGISTSGSPNYQDISGRSVYVAPQQTAQQAVNQQVQQEMGQRYSYTPAQESQIQNALVNPNTKMANMSTERGDTYARPPEKVNTAAKYFSYESAITPQQRKKTERTAFTIIGASIGATAIAPAVIAAPLPTVGAIASGIAVPEIAKYGYRTFDKKEGIIYDEEYNKGIEAGFQNIKTLYGTDTPFMKTARSLGATDDTPVVKQIETGSKAVRNFLVDFAPSPGLNLVFGKENVDKTFAEGFLQYGSEADLQNAQGEKIARNIGQTASLISVSAFVERGAQKSLAQVGSKGGIVPESFLGKITSVTKKTSPTFARWGFIEGSTNEISRQLGTEENINPERIVKSGIGGSVIATPLGVTIYTRSLYPASSKVNKAIKYGVEYPTNIADPSEPLGDYLEAGVSKLQYNRGARIVTPTIITTTNDKGTIQTYASISQQKGSKYSQITPSPTYTQSTLLVEQQTPNKNTKINSIVRQPSKQYTITNDVVKVPTPTTTRQKSTDYLPDITTPPRKPSKTPTKDYIITNDFVQTPTTTQTRAQTKTQTNTIISTTSINTFVPQKFAIIPPIGVVDAPGGEGKFSFGFGTEGKGKGQYLPSVAGIASGITISKTPTFTSGIGIRFPVMERPNATRSTRRKQNIQVNINVLRKNDKTKNKTGRTKYRKSRR